MNHIEHNEQHLLALKLNMFILRINQILGRNYLSENVCLNSVKTFRFHKWMDLRLGEGLWWYMMFLVEIYIVKWVVRFVMAVFFERKKGIPHEWRNILTKRKKHIQFGRKKIVCGILYLRTNNISLKVLPMNSSLCVRYSNNFPFNIPNIPIERPPCHNEASVRDKTRSLHTKWPCSPNEKVNWRGELHCGGWRQIQTFFP